MSNIDPPKEFSSDYIGDPVITYIDNGSLNVPLKCEAPLFHGIGAWANVTYQVQWFADGVPFWHGERRLGGCDSCPVVPYIDFRLEGKRYKLGQTVSKHVSKPLSVEMLVATNNYIIIEDMKQVSNQRNLE